MITRHCLAQKSFSYNLSRINEGKNDFRLGDDVFVAIADFPRLARKGLVKSIEEEDSIAVLREVNYQDAFPKISSEIWVFGDGPTATSARDLPGERAVIFGLNRCFFDPLSLVPDYYVALDDGMMTSEEHRIHELTSIRKFTKRGNHISGKWDWPDLRFFDVLGELGFSEENLEVYHGKTTAYCALQLAVQCGRDYIDSGLTIHLAGIDLAVLKNNKDNKITHHYGNSAYDDCLFTRMLTSLRYGLNHLNEIGVKWVNYSPLLASRVKDLEVS